MPKSLKDTVKGVLLENENAASLKPKSKESAPPQKLDGEVEDLGGPVVKNDQADFPKANKKIKKTDTPGPNPPVGAEPMKKLSEELEDVEMTEELKAAIDEMVKNGLTEDEIIEIIKEAKEDSDDDDDDDSKDSKDDNDDDSKDSEDDDDDDDKDVKEEIKVDVSEDMKAIFDGSDLSEEFKAKVQTIMETAIKTKVESIRKVMLEKYAKELESAEKEIAESMETKVDKLIQSIAEEYMVENEVAIESTLRTELTEDFISGLRNLFLENYIDVPEDKVDVVENMGTKVTDLEEQLNSEMQKNLDLKEEIKAVTKKNIILSMTEGMVATKAEKIRSLAENTEFVNEEDFKAKVKTLTESYFPDKPVKKDDSLKVEISDEPEKSMVNEELAGDMARYVKAITKSLPK